MRLIRCRAGTALLVAIAAAPAMAASQADLDRLAAGLGYRQAVISNRPDCPKGLDPCFLSTLRLTVPDDAAAIPGLSLYFGFVNRLPLVESSLFTHELVNGDLQRLTLKPGAVLEPGSTHDIRLWGTGSHFSRAFAMPNAYLVADGLEARTIEASRPRIDPDTGMEILPFVPAMTDEARQAAANPADRTRWLTAARAYPLNLEREAPLPSGVVILPKPVQAVQRGGAAVDLRKGYALRLDGIAEQALAPALDALGLIGVKPGGPVPLSVRIDARSGLVAEAYRLEAGPGGVDITAADADGARHALRSLVQQAAFEQGRLTPLRVEDAPLHGHRGLHLDLGRNFHGRDQILKLIEAMAGLKLNRLHLHLADDEGWRIEIPALPELAAIGSRRCHDPAETRCLQPQLGAGPDGASAVNGYLSVADYQEIVAAAAARGIAVIPSIDMPGHSRAAVKAMEARHARLLAEGHVEEAGRYRLIDPADTTAYRSIQNYNDNMLNVCLPSTYRFLDAVVDALAAMHEQAGAPLRIFHLGADETAGAWVRSPACSAMIAENGGDARKLTPRFIERIARSLAARGIRTGGWSDGMGHSLTANMPGDVQSNIWGTLHGGAIREAHDQMNRGWHTVLSIPDFGYFDMPHAPHPDEGGYDWASRGVSLWQVFAFMPDNLPANAALIPTIMAEPKPIADMPMREPGRGIAGVQAQLWSETIRTDSAVDYMLFPRLLALAERGWSAAPWTPAYQPGASYAWQDRRVDRAALDAGWRDFAGRVAAHLPLLDRTGIRYRVPPPGARLENGRLHANSELPGLAVEYRVNGGGWRRYAGPVAVEGAVELRARSADGRRASRIVTP